MNKNTPSDFRRLFSEMVAQTDEDIDLAKAALYVSGIEYPNIDVDYYLTTLDSLAEEANSYASRSGDLGETIRGLSEFLFVDQEFRGNEAEYYDPRNSYLNEVLDRKSGIPITLCLLYMEVARRMGMVFEGIGLPGHFVIRTGPPDQELYVDPFHGGQRMSRSDCEQTVRVLFQGRIPFQDEFLRPYTKREFLVRIITNLKHNYFRTNDYQRAVNAADLINILDPSLVSNLREKAVLHYNLKQYRLAIRDLESYLEKDPNASDAEDVRKQVQAIWSILRSLN
jgi:regulator of sirC expression with transglutaminase-like and TPR domain